MGIGDDNSLVWVVLVPIIGGLVGFLLLGPVGFFVGGVIPLVIGGLVDSDGTAKDEQIDQLNQQVDDLERQIEELETEN